MTLTIFDQLDQGTDEWLQARCGIVTASVIGQLITPKTVTLAKNGTAESKLVELSAERITGRVEVTFPTRDMQRGNLLEPFARDLYSERFEPVHEVGFMRLDTDMYTLGYSPDGLVGDLGLIEIKSPRPKIHLATIMAGEVPSQYMAQLQTGLFVSGRAWIDFISYVPGMPLYVQRVTPDIKWFNVITEADTHAEASIKENVTAYKTATDGLTDTEWFDPFGEEEIF
jgi:hypothetical protein